MKGNVFSQWLKEFCALVFTQTVQAFLLAIVLLIVIVSISNGSDSGNNFANVTAGGVLAIVALTSISKMESLIKKLFGIESSITDTSMKGGKPGLLGSIAAIKMAKRALNNIPQIGKGISGSFKAKNAERQAAIELNNKMKRLDARYGNNNTASNNINGNPVQSNGTQVRTQIEPNNQGTNIVSGVNNSNVTVDNIKNLSSDVTAGINNSKVAKNSQDSNSSKNTDKYEDKKEKIYEEYNKKLADAKKLGKDSRKQILSGVAETGGAIAGAGFGAVAGAVMAAGTGDGILDNTAKGMGIGIGVGDMLGQGTIKAAYAPSNIKNTISGYKDTLEKYNKNIDQIKKIEKDIKKFNAGDID